ncbi:ankyrin repeat-containing domain protein [Trichophaea hybrida]|nr:ankyrin repeat-containing domain protein [Trichophaea hybrida]
MYVLGAAANIVSLVTVALQSAKVIQEILSGIKDGPTLINELTSKLSDLRGLLLQLERLPSTSGTKLAKLRNVPGDRRWAKVRKGLKTMLKEDEFLSMRRKLGDYMDSFSVLLGLIGVSSQQETRSDLENIKNMLSTLIATMKRTPEISPAQLSSFLTSAQPVCHSSAQSMHSLPQQPITPHNSPAQPVKTSYESIGGRSAKSECEVPTSIDCEDEISESVDRLCRLAKKKEITVFSGDEAFAIIDDLEKLLDVVSNNMSPFKLAEGKGKRKWDGINPLSKDESRDFKRAKGLLNSSPSISLNESAQIQHSGSFGGPKTLIAGKCMHRKFETGIGSVFVLFRNRRRMDPTSGRDEPEDKIFAGTMSFMPNSTGLRNNKSFRISVSLEQAIKSGGILLSPQPTISFSAVLPENSEVFNLAKTGDLDGLVRLFSEGKASLSDCDTSGRSLLTYACYGLQPNVCKFLLERGADPDLISLDFGYTNYMIGLLLDAGADPTLSVEPSDSAAIFKVPSVGTVESLRQLLDRGSYFVDLGLTNELGETPLLYLARACAIGGKLPDMISLLLSKGASVKARDRLGQTCLHILLADYDPTAEPDTHPLRAALTMLVNAGADVRTEDYRGETVSYFAYLFGHGKLWEEILTACGFKAEEVCGEFYQNYGCPVPGCDHSDE